MSSTTSDDRSSTIPIGSRSATVFESPEPSSTSARSSSRTMSATETPGAASPSSKTTSANTEHSSATSDAEQAPSDLSVVDAQIYEDILKDAEEIRATDPAANVLPTQGTFDTITSQYQKLASTISKQSCEEGRGALLHVIAAASNLMRTIDPSYQLPSFRAAYARGTKDAMLGGLFHFYATAVAAGVSEEDAEILHTGIETRASLILQTNVVDESAWQALLLRAQNDLVALIQKHCINMSQGAKKKTVAMPTKSSATKASRKRGAASGNHSPQDAYGSEDQDGDGDVDMEDSGNLSGGSEDIEMDLPEDPVASTDKVSKITKKAQVAGFVQPTVRFGHRDWTWLQHIMDHYREALFQAKWTKGYTTCRFSEPDVHKIHKIIFANIWGSVGANTIVSIVSSIQKTQRPEFRANIKALSTELEREWRGTCEVLARYYRAKATTGSFETIGTDHEDAEYNVAAVAQAQAVADIERYLFKHGELNELSPEERMGIEAIRKAIFNCTAVREQTKAPKTMHNLQTSDYAVFMASQEGQTKTEWKVDMAWANLLTRICRFSPCQLFAIDKDTHRMMRSIGYQKLNRAFDIFEKIEGTEEMALTVVDVSRLLYNAFLTREPKLPETLPELIYHKRGTDKNWQIMNTICSQHLAPSKT